MYIPPPPASSGPITGKQGETAAFRTLICTDAAIKLIKDNLPGTWQSFGIEGHKIFVKGKFNPQDKAAARFFNLCQKFSNNSEINGQTMSKIFQEFKPEIAAGPSPRKVSAKPDIVSKIIEQARAALQLRKDTAEILGKAAESDEEVQKARHKLLAWEKKYGVSAEAAGGSENCDPSPDYTMSPVEAVKPPATSGPGKSADVSRTRSPSKEGTGQSRQNKIDQNMSPTQPPAKGGSLQTISLTNQFKINISGSNFSDEAQYFGARDATKIHVFFMGNYEQNLKQAKEIKSTIEAEAKKQGNACLVIWQEVHGKIYSKKGVLELVNKLGESYQQIDIHGHSNGASGGVSAACPGLIANPKIGTINLISSYLDWSYQQDKTKAQNLINKGKIHFFNAQREAVSCINWQQQRGLAPDKVTTINGVGHYGALLHMIPEILNPKASG
ncbi:MAG: hypothetical protein PHV30_08575 [Candidatus Margulisbacteria bacterium]|nr:hypothetical protein [Candidatus Margulisiibacteriota bacterium]